MLAVIEYSQRQSTVHNYAEATEDILWRPGWCSCCNDLLQHGWSRFQMLVGARNFFLLYTFPDQPRGPTHPLQWVPEFFPGSKWARHGIVRVKNE